MPNISFRALSSASDYAAMRQVRLGCVEHDSVDLLSIEEAVPSEDEYVFTFAMGDQNLLLAEIDGEIIGYHFVRWWDHARGYSYLHRGYILPKWRGMGLGTMMLRWAERRIREIAASHPYEQQKQYRAYVSSGERDAMTLLLNEAYQPYSGLLELKHDLQMLPDAVLPEGFIIQPVAADNYRAIWEALEAAFADEAERSTASEDSYQGFLSDPKLSATLWQVVWHANQVVGVSFGGVSDIKVGYISQLGIKPSWRRLGLGRALCVQMLHLLKAHGAEQARVLTDAENPYGAQRMFEKIGFTIVKEYYRYRKPLV
jgi:ribosomal protein S18 acetylase RimI-like enzyme